MWCVHGSEHTACVEVARPPDSWYHCVVVVEGLAHPHEDYISDLGIGTGVNELFHDFTHGQVADFPHRSCGGIGD